MAAGNGLLTDTRSTVTSTVVFVCLLTIALCSIGTAVRSDSVTRSAHVVSVSTLPAVDVMGPVIPSEPDSSITDEARTAVDARGLTPLDSALLPTPSSRRNIVRSALVPRSRPSPSLRS